jgi:glucosamine--fructose-6-phosphate aminotransferase (isomerizing)
MIGVILLCLNCSKQESKEIFRGYIPTIIPKFEIIAWSKNNYKVFVNSSDSEEITTGMNFILNTNKYETGLDSNFIIKKGESTAIIAIEGIPKMSPKELSEKLWQIFKINQSETELMKLLKDKLSHENGSFSVVCYFKENHKEFLVAFSTYRYLFINKKGKEFLLTTVEELTSENWYELPPNSLVFWSLKKGAFTEIKAKAKINRELKHFMIKEIHDTPHVLKRIHSLINYPHIHLTTEIIKNSKRIWVIGNGSSLNAGLELQYFLPTLDITGISAFEFKMYKLSSVGEDDAIIAITQSGNTWDVVEVAKECKSKGVKVISITNNPFGKITEYSDVVIPILAGYEFAVPATKSFTGTLGILYLLSLVVKRKFGLINEREMNMQLHNFSNLADKLSHVLPKYEASAKKTAKSIQNMKGGYITSAGLTYPIAIEGALKLKETAYSHAEPIELEEYLHGPSAALSADMYNIVIQPYEDYAKKRFLQKFEKFYEDVGQFVVIGAIQEIQEKIKDIKNVSLVEIDQTDPMLYSFYVTLFVQLLSYWLGVYRRTPIDSPKGLSKAIMG